MAYLNTRFVADNDDPDPTPTDPGAAALLPRRLLLNIFAVAGQLGQRRRTLPYIVRYLDQLVEHAGFPSPLPVNTRKGLIRTAHKDSQWLADAVEAWLAGQAPAPLAPSIDAATMAAAGNRMDANAGKLRAGLRLVLGGVE